MTCQPRVGRGLTLMETMIAATIVLLVLLSLLGTIAFGLSGTQNSEGSQQAVLHARQTLELIRERRLLHNEAHVFSDAANDRLPLETPLVAPPSGEDPIIDFPPNTGYSRRVVSERLSSDPNDYRCKLYRIEVTVFWKAKTRENSFRLVGYDRAP